MERSRSTRLATALGLLSTSAYERSAGPGEPLADESLERRRALAELAELSRWERLESLLLDPDHGILGELAPFHDLELGTGGDGPDAVVSISSAASARRELPRRLAGDPDLPYTDLAAVLDAAYSRGVESLEAVVLCTDGRHNRPGSPLVSARRLGAAGIKVHVVGTGSADEPVDLAVVDVRVPRTAYLEDRLEGTLSIKVRAASGERFVVSIHEARREGDNDKDKDKDNDNGEVGEALWRQEIVVPAGGAAQLRELSFALAAGSLEAGRSSLVAMVSPISNEVAFSNNERAFLATVKKRDLNILLVARPGWESRYLKNLFERDPRIRVNHVTSGVDPDRVGLERGRADGTFPEAREDLERYDLVVVGDLPSEFWRPEELEWMRAFVERGGGLIWIAGRHGHLAGYRETPLSVLLPVEFPDNIETPWAPGSPIVLRLTPTGRELPALRLAPDEELNAEMWSWLRPLTWVQPAAASEGSETWAVAIDIGRGRATAPLPDGTGIPVLVSRTFGRGRVLYVGTDQTWRWRYKAGDRYHHHVWGQIVDHFREEAFAVEGDRIALDSESAIYDAADPIDVRVRWLDAAGEPVEGDGVVVEVLRDGAPLRELTLPPAGGGVYRGALTDLEPGRYDLRARLDNLSPEDEALRLPFIVAGETDREDLFLSWDETLVRQIASTTGGVYLREEEIAQLPGLLAADGRYDEETREIELSRSWLWLALITAFLAIEWALRKRAGLL